MSTLPSDRTEYQKEKHYLLKVLIPGTKQHRIDTGYDFLGNNGIKLPIHQHRDSGLLDQSNFASAERALSEVCEASETKYYIRVARSGHWAVGWVESLYLAVDWDGDERSPESVPFWYPESEDDWKVIKEVRELVESLDYYPILDESDYQERQDAATEENIAFVIAGDERLLNFLGTLDSERWLGDYDEEGQWPLEDEINNIQTEHLSDIYPPEEILEGNVVCRTCGYPYEHLPSDEDSFFIRDGWKYIKTQVECQCGSHKYQFKLANVGMESLF